jgi:protein-S-isoprenylcysteine O-methyltransferase Ste14
LDCARLGHVRESVLFIHPANPVGAWPYSDQHWSLPRFVRHPGYTVGLLAAVTSGIALGSWISTFIAPIALALLVWRTIVEDRMLQRDLPGYANYAARVPYRLVPGVW